jgi:hypothetical protein
MRRRNTNAEGKAVQLWEKRVSKRTVDDSQMDLSAERIFFPNLDSR